MSFDGLADEVLDAIRSYLGDGISTGAWTLAPIAYPNDAFVVPDPPSPWVALEIAGTLYGQESIGEPDQALNRWDEEGNLFLHVMVPVGTGGSQARAAAITLANLFRGRTLLSGDLEFIDAGIGMGEVGDDSGAWYRVSVSIDWRHWNA